MILIFRQSDKTLTRFVLTEEELDSLHDYCVDIYAVDKDKEIE